MGIDTEIFIGNGILVRDEKDIKTLLDMTASIDFDRLGMKYDAYNDPNWILLSFDKSERKFDRYPPFVSENYDSFDKNNTKWKSTFKPFQNISANLLDSGYEVFNDDKILTGNFKGIFREYDEEYSIRGKQIIDNYMYELDSNFKAKNAVSKIAKIVNSYSDPNYHKSGRKINIPGKWLCIYFD